MKFKFNSLFLIIGLIHFAISLFITIDSYKYSEEQIIIYSLFKVLTFIIIILSWQLPPFLYNEIRKGNDNIKDFFKFSSTYFIINFIVMILIWPGYTDCEFLNSYLGIKSNMLTTFWHFLSSFFQGISYHIIPTIWGVSLVNIFIQSIIFGYCINNTKKYISSNYHLLLFLPFCIPAILILNTAPIRLIYVTWIATFIMFFIFLNQNKEINNKAKAILFGVITGLFISFRTEYFPLLFFVPLTLLSLRIFNKKNLIICILSLFSIFTISTFIQKSELGLEYELHNLAFVYRTTIQNNLKCTNFEQKRNELSKVFVETNTQDFIINSSNQTNNKKAISILINMLFENANYFFIRNIKLFTNGNTQIVNKSFYIPEQNPFLNREAKNILNKDITVFNQKIRENTIRLLVYGNKKINIKKYCYNPLYNYSILLIMAIYGIIKRKYFYIHYFLIWSSILFVILLTMPWGNFLYLWAFFLNTYLILFLSIIEYLESKIKQNFSN